MVRITGNTYSVRSQLKAMGCRWSASAKCWMAPPSVAAQAQAIVPKGRSGGGGGRVPKTCRTCRCRINYGVFCGKCEYA